jgi:ribonuclease HI
VKAVEIYTDGACLGNPGPGGYGAVLIYGPHRRELSGGFRLTTNNRMEMMGAIVALNALTEPCAVTLYSDSKYVVDAMVKGWAKRWQARNWMRTKTEPALNPDLWADLLQAGDRHQVTWRWVKGHAGNPENERCDRLAVAAAHQPQLPPDLGYSGKRGG